jgi:hypothetical protein
MNSVPPELETVAASLTKKMFNGGISYSDICKTKA